LKELKCAAVLRAVFLVALQDIRVEMRAALKG
jgi:hypothetical protein